MNRELTHQSDYDWQKDVDALELERDTARQQVEELENGIMKMSGEIRRLNDWNGELKADHASEHARRTAAETRATAAERRADSAEIQLQVMTARCRAAEADCSRIQYAADGRIDALTAKLSANSHLLTVASQSADQTRKEVDALKEKVLRLMKAADQEIDHMTNIANHNAFTAVEMLAEKDAEIDRLRAEIMVLKSAGKGELN